MKTVSTLLIIFGISGDLSTRKLLPSLGALVEAGYLEDTKIVGISRQAIEVTKLLDASLAGASEAVRGTLEESIEIVTMDVSQAEAYESLSEKIGAYGALEQVIFYLSVPPAATLSIVERLGAAGLNGPHVKLLLEKPFGVDLDSATEAIERVAAYYDEDQVYRIDHYLAKEMAQNIIAFRSHNAIFRNLWHADFIEKIDIVASERIGIEGRANFYEQTGALRDFVQNHLMQLMALTLMDIPAGFDQKQLPQKRLAALEDVVPIPADALDRLAVRGQYDTYQADVGNPGSLTETFVSLTLYSKNERWRGVPIRLATGKSLAARTTEIRVYFRRTHVAESNLLILHIQPKEGIEIDLWAKKPGYDKDYEKKSLQFDYQRPAGKPIDAYERVLLDAFQSDKSLFAGADEVLASWKILQPIQAHWAFQGSGLKQYAAGTPIENLLSSEI